MARTILPEELTKMGAHVDEVTAYETKLDDDRKDALLDALKENAIDAVTFTSSSTVSNFMSLIQKEDTKTLLKDVTIASIGPITSDTAKDLGITPDIEAQAFTISGLVDALTDYYSKG